MSCIHLYSLPFAHHHDCRKPEKVDWKPDRQMQPPHAAPPVATMLLAPSSDRVLSYQAVS